MGLVLVTLLAYLPMRTAGFVYEDAGTLAQLGLNSDWTLTLTSLMFGAQPVAHHAVNLLIHLANGLLLGLSASTAYGAGIGVLASAILLLHPLNSEAVSYVAARGELLSAFWLLLAIWIVVSFRRAPMQRSLAIVACAVLAMLAKPSGIVVLGLVPFVVFVTHHDELWDGLGVGWLLLLVAGSSRALAVWQNPYTFGSVLMPFDYWGAQAVAVCVSLSHVLAPIGLSIDPDWEAASMLARSACLVGLIALLTYGWRVRSVLIAWLALGLWPRFVLRPPELLHDHHFYVPMLGLSVACAFWLSRVTERACAA